MKKCVAVILLLVLVLSLCACNQEQPVPLREEDIRAICELATLECFYNNVAKIEKEADNIFQKDRTMWIEYEGKATIGIKMSDVVIQVSGNTVNITMPDAEILSTDYTFTEDSYVASADGWLWPNKISTEDQQAGVIEGQEAMKESIKNNTALFLKAEDRAKELIENYITQLGEAAGVEYTINWTK